MDWTDVKITIPQSAAELAEAIAVGISGGGVYIEPKFHVHFLLA